MLSTKSINLLTKNFLQLSFVRRLRDIIEYITKLYLKRSLLYRKSSYFLFLVSASLHKLKVNRVNIKKTLTSQEIRVFSVTFTYILLFNILEHFCISLHSITFFRATWPPRGTWLDTIPIEFSTTENPMPKAFGF